MYHLKMLAKSDFLNSFYERVKQTDTVETVLLFSGWYDMLDIIVYKFKNKHGVPY